MPLTLVNKSRPQNHFSMVNPGKGRKPVPVVYRALAARREPAAALVQPKPCPVAPLARQSILREVEFLLRECPMIFPKELR